MYGFIIILNIKKLILVWDNYKRLFGTSVFAFALIDYKDISFTWSMY